MESLAEGTISAASCSATASRENIMLLGQSGADAIVSKTCTLEPIANPTVDYEFFYHFDGFGSVNQIGLVNPGFDYYKKLRPAKPYVISVAGTPDELSVMMTDVCCRADGFEINVACRNAPRYHNADLDDLFLLDFPDIRQTRMKLGIKLPPFQDHLDVRRTADVIKRLNRELPVDYVVCCNTLERGALGKFVGSLAGKYLQPVSMWNVREMKQNLEDVAISVVGAGGVTSIADVRAYHDAGASGVQIGTGLIEEGLGIFDRIKRNAVAM